MAFELCCLTLFPTLVLAVTRRVAGVRFMVGDVAQCLLGHPCLRVLDLRGFTPMQDR
jgi:hypothetical protein